jgi:hypothetical protein
MKNRTLRPQLRFFDNGVFLKTLHCNFVEALVNRLPRWNILIVLHDEYKMMQKHNRPSVYFGA